MKMTPLVVVLSLGLAACGESEPVLHNVQQPTPRFDALTGLAPATPAQSRSSNVMPPAVHAATLKSYPFRPTATGFEAVNPIHQMTVELGRDGVVLLASWR